MAAPGGGLLAPSFDRAIPYPQLDRLQLGNSAINLGINAGLELNNDGYDSDISFAYLEETTSDYSGWIGVPIQILVPLGKSVVFNIFDKPQYAFYLRTERERAWNNTIGGYLHVALDRFYIQGGGGFTNVRQRLSPELDINFRQKETLFDGLMLWQASRATSFALLFGRAKYDYGDAEFGGIRIAETLNRSESLIDLITYYEPTPRLRLYVDGQLGTYVFEAESSGFKDAHSYGVIGGLEFIPRER